MDPFVAEIRIFPFNFAPSGWAFCDGQLLPLSQNTALFSLLGTVYGGDGKSTFALPDMQGCAPMHPGQGPGLSLRDLEKQFELARSAWRNAGRERPPRLAVGFWFALGSRGREQIEAHLRRYLDWLAPGEIDPLLPIAGFAGSAGELRALLRQIADLGADEVQLVSTALDPDQVERAAEAIG